MMYRDSSFRMRMSNGNLLVQRRVLIFLCVVLLIAAAVFGVMALRSSRYRAQSNEQILQRTISAVSSAIDEVARMDSIVTSNTPARLSRVRQYVYSAEQFNILSIALNGEGGRLASADAFVTLYADLDHLESVIQASKTSTQDGRTALQAHLAMLRQELTGQ